MSSMTRRNILQLAVVPAFLSRAQVADLAPTVSRVYPGDDGEARLRTRRAGQHHSRQLARRIRRRRRGHSHRAGEGDHLARRRRQHGAPCRRPSTRCRRCRSTATAFAARCFCGPASTRLATPVTIRASGVVLRGEGMGDTGTILIGTGTGRPAGARGRPAGHGRSSRRRWPCRRSWTCRRTRCGRRAGASRRSRRRGGRARGGRGWPRIRRRPAHAHPHRRRLGARDVRTTRGRRSPTSTCRSVRAAFTVASARGFRPGDTVIVRRIGNQDVDRRRSA